MVLGIQRILVLCEGNHCRSPLAEALLKAQLGPGFEVASAGLAALVGRPAHPEAVRLLAERGLDLSSHRGRQLTPDLALAADLILVMDARQKEACERLVPSARGRVYLLGQWLPAGEQAIDDPVLGPAEAHLRALEHLERALQPWIDRLSPLTPARNP
jgi:protein-tyrosine phosphatase